VSARSRDDVVDRALALCAHYLRSRVEGGLRFGPAGDSRHRWRAFGDRVQTWATAEGIPSRMSPRERRAWRARLGSWSEQTIIDGNWRLEALGPLLWALSALRTMPAWDRQFDHAIVAKLGAPPFNGTTRVTATSFRVRARLRDDETSERYRDIAELWHWRANIAQLPRTAERARNIANAARVAHQRGDVAAPLANDFPLFRRTYSKLTDEQLSLAHSIAEERQLALEWLTGDDAWDETRADT